MLVIFHIYWSFRLILFIKYTQHIENSHWFHHNQKYNTNYVMYSVESIPPNSECKNPLEKFSPRLFGIKTTSFTLIIFERAKLLTRSITYLCWCIWGTFWRKNATGISPSGSCSCTTMPQLPGHLQPRRNWRTWASSVLITHPIFRIWPRRTTTCSLDWKNNWKVAIFLPKWRLLLPRDLVRRTTSWFFFFSGLQKL